ncbi:MAG: hypothetical protein RR806_07130 [Oscillospiraceae bacterium]
MTITGKAEYGETPHCKRKWTAKGCDPCLQMDRRHNYLWHRQHPNINGLHGWQNHNLGGDSGRLRGLAHSQHKHRCGKENGYHHSDSRNKS